MKNLGKIRLVNDIGSEMCIYQVLRQIKVHEKR